jgi:hypothetical protein
MHLRIYLLRKKYHTAFQAPLLGINDPSDDANKRQQAFLAPLSGKALVKRITKFLINSLIGIHCSYS